MAAAEVAMLDLNLPVPEAAMLDLNLTPPDEFVAAIPPEEHVDEMVQDGHENDQDAGIVNRIVKKRNSLNGTQRYAAYVAMHILCMSRGGKFKRGDKKDIAKKIQADIQIIQKNWKDAMKQIVEGLPVDVSGKRKGRCGRKPIEINLSLIPTIPLNKRSTIRSLAWQLECSPTTSFTRFKMDQIRRHPSALKPKLTEKQKKSRVQFSASFLDETTTGNPEPLFSNMFDVVHADEKWFNMTKDHKKLYLLHEEEDPTRAIPPNCIGKVMFLTAVARPRFDSAGNMTFDGKIGMWPFLIEVPAQRRSAKREKGVLETKNLTVTREVMRECFIHKLLPAIEAVWPKEDKGKPIFIQQDNAKPHLLPTDPEFAAAVATTGLDIRLMQQPANSPDLNVLDLGFFRSIQSLTNCLSPKTLREFIKGAEKEFHAYESSILNRIFLTLQACMLEIMNHRGGNGYKTPHVNKSGLENEGQLPIRIKCIAEVYATALEVLGQDVN